MAGSDWPSWRGPNFNGSVEQGSYPVRWGSNATWKVELPGKGTSTPAVLGNRVFVTCPAEGQDAVIAFDLKGTRLWQTLLGPASEPRHRTLASSCNASPVTDGQSLFVYFRSGTLAALDLDGKVKWKINLVDKFGAENLYWDTGASPAVSGQFVIMPRVHSGESWIAAFDKDTGDSRWKTPRNYEVPRENDNGYTTPLVIGDAAHREVLLWGAEHLTAYDLNTGKLNGWVGDFNPRQTGNWPHIATPVVVDGIAVVPVGRDDRNQGQIHGVRLGGVGDRTSSNKVWKREDLGVFVSSPIAYRNRIYLLRHKGRVACLNPATGETIWTAALPESASAYFSSPTVAAGRLYAAREDGTVFVASVEDQFQLFSENPMGERIIAAPVPAADRIFLRGDRHLFCIEGTELSKK